MPLMQSRFHLLQRRTDGFRRAHDTFHHTSNSGDIISISFDSQPHTKLCCEGLVVYNLSFYHPFPLESNSQRTTWDARTETYSACTFLLPPNNSPQISTRQPSPSHASKFIPISDTQALRHPHQTLGADGPCTPTHRIRRDPLSYSYRGKEKS